MSKALIVYNTRTGETRRIGELIAEGLRMGGMDATLMDVKDIKSESQLAGFDAYVFGSATYHGDMMQGMKTFLFLAEKAGLGGMVGGAFGAFGWSGEACDRIYGTMEHILKMKMVNSALRLKASTLGGGQRMAQDYGREIAQKFQAG